MTKTLLLVGWKVDFACAAAAFNSKYPNAEIMGMSRNGLPRFLENLAKEKNHRFKHIIIFGVPLSADSKKLIGACGKLKKKKIEIIWMLSYPLSTVFPAGLKKLVKIDKAKEEIPLCRFVCDTFDIKHLPANRIARHDKDGDKLEGDGPERRDLINAAMSRCRRFGDEKIFSDIIRFISKNKKLDAPHKILLEEYRKFGSRELKGGSNAVRELKHLAKKIGVNSSCSVLITGETGTGKETVANLVHGYSNRSTKPFIAFNCADLSPQLIESRLFGHEKGSFTGAEKMRKGAFELANEGTLFLDEVAELPMSAQAGLLRVLQEKKYFRLGGENEIEANVRIIAATNKNLYEMARNGKFREDLIYRLDIVNVHIPPLRDRKEDIEPIANGFMLDKGKRRFSTAQIEALKGYDWPGNIRELQNILERSIAMGVSNFTKLLTEQKNKFNYSSSVTESDLLEDAIKEKVKSIYEKCSLNKTQAAEKLGISVNTLKKYLKV